MKILILKFCRQTNELKIKIKKILQKRKKSPFFWYFSPKIKNFNKNNGFPVKMLNFRARLI